MVSMNNALSHWWGEVIGNGAGGPRNKCVHADTTPGLYTPPVCTGARQPPLLLKSFGLACGVPEVFFQNLNRTLLKVFLWLPLTFQIKPKLLGGGAAF